jgi:hypothetical protein
LQYFVKSIKSEKSDFTDSLWGWNNHTNGYYENLPRIRNYTNRQERESACANGNQASQYGFACPHLMMLSADMILASKYDNNGNNFIYATAGGSSDNDCGSCYQVKLLDAEREWNDTLSKKHLIIQIINSGYDVQAGQFDIFMGAGGFGYFTGCNSDCKTKYCHGGGCKDNLYAGSFDQWTDAQYNDPNICYSGGIKWLDQNSSIEELCKKPSNYETGLKDKILHDSCVATNKLLYHQNFVSTDSLRVQCPEGLYRATGLRRNDDSSCPIAHIDNQLNIECRGSRNKGKYCISTMMDCCKTSCSWSNKVNTDHEWMRADTCDRNGLIFDYF